MQPVRGYFRSQSAALMAMAGAQGESFACNHLLCSAKLCMYLLVLLYVEGETLRDGFIP